MKSYLYEGLLILIFIFYFFIYLTNIDHHCLGWVDNVKQFLPYIEYLSQTTIKEKTVPFWWHYTGLGYPFVGALQAGVFYPLNYLNLFFPQPLGYNIVLLLHFLWLQIATFIYTNYLLKRPFFSFLAALFFGYSFFVLSSLDIYPLILASGYYVFNFYLIHKIMDNLDQEKNFLENTQKNLSLIFLLSLSLSFEFLTGYPQIFVYNLLYIFIYILVYTMKKRKQLLFSLCIFIISIFLILPLIFVQLLSTIELLPNTYRSMLKEIIYNNFSFPPYMLLTYVFPYIFGDTKVLEYWGPYYEQFFNTIKNHLINYISIITIPTGIFSLYIVFKLRKSNLYPLIFTGFISLILSFGYYGLLHYAMYFVPIYSDIRAHLRNNFQFNLSLSILSSFGLLVFLKILVLRFTNVYSFLFAIYKVFLKNYFYFLLICLILFLIIEPQSFTSLLESFKINHLYIFYSFLFLSIYIFVFYLLISKKKKIFIFLIPLIFIIEKIVFLENMRLNPLNRKIDITLGNNLFEQVKLSSKIERNSLVVINRIEGNDYVFFPTTPTNYIALKMDIRILNIYDPFFSEKYYNIFSINDVGFSNPFSLIYHFKNPLFSSMYGIDYFIFENMKSENIFERFLKINRSSNPEDFKIQKSFFATNITTPYNIEFSTNNNYNYHVMFIEIDKPPLTKIQKAKKAFYNMQEFIQIWVNSKYSLEEITLESNNSLLIIPFLTFENNVKLTIYSHSKLRNIKIKKIEIISYPDEIPSYVKSSPWELVYQRKGKFSIIYQIWKNKQSLGKAFGVENIQIVDNLDKFREKIYKLEFDPTKTAIILKDQLPKVDQYKKLGILKFDIEKTSFSKPIIKNLKFFEKPDTIELDTLCEDISFLVINSHYFKGWKAYINNQEIPILETNGYVSGIILPKGEHHLVLKFEPYYKKLFPLPFIFMLFYIILIIRFYLKKSNKKNS